MFQDWLAGEKPGGMVPLAWLAHALLLNSEQQAAAFAQAAGFPLGDQGCFCAKKVKLVRKWPCLNSCIGCDLATIGSAICLSACDFSKCSTVCLNVYVPQVPKLRMILHMQTVHCLKFCCSFSVHLLVDLLADLRKDVAGI